MGFLGSDEKSWSLYSWMSYGVIECNDINIHEIIRSYYVDQPE
jgi:hypothetical protein